MFKRIFVFLLTVLILAPLPAGAIKYKGDLESNESITFPEQASKPTSPAATKHKLYFKDDGGLYQLDSSGTERRAALTGYKNKLINGNFRLWGRGVGPGIISVEYQADRWGKHNFQRAVPSRQDFVASGDHPGNSKYVLRNAGDGSTAARLGSYQGIESWDTYSLRGKTVTLSGYIRFSAASITSSTSLGVSLGYTNAAADGVMNSSNYQVDGSASTR